MRNKSDRPDGAVARLAAGQHGVVTARQLLEVGLSRSGIARRVDAGRLHLVHRGVYAVGHRGLSQEGLWTAAVLACDEGAVLSHRSAAALWRLLPPGPGTVVDVSIPSSAGRKKRAGIRLHRCASLAAPGGSLAVTKRSRIPATTPARTLRDLKGTVPGWQWRKAVRQAEFKEMSLGGIETDRTRSDLERDFLALCRRFDLPTPEVNVKIGSWTVDFLWRRERLAVETDSYLYHRGRIAFQDDKARDLDLRRLGFEVRHFSEQLVNERPAEVAADLRRTLSAALVRAGDCPDPR